MLLTVVALAALELLRDGRTLLVGHHAELDVDVRDPLERHHRVGDQPDDLRPHRAAGNGQRDGDLDVPGVDLDPAHHVQLDDRAMDLGVLDRAQGFEHLGLAEGPGVRLAGHDWASREFPLRT